MSIELYWDNPERTMLYYGVQGQWNWRQLFGRFLQAQGMMAGVPHRVDSILDLSDADPWPGSGALLHFQIFCDEQPANAGLIALVSEKAAVRSLVRLAMKFDANIAGRLRLARTLNDAQVILLVDRVVQANQVDAAAS